MSLFSGNQVSCNSWPCFPCPMFIARRTRWRELRGTIVAGSLNPRMSQSFRSSSKRLTICIRWAKLSQHMCNCHGIWWFTRYVRLKNIRCVVQTDTLGTAWDGPPKMGTPKGCTKSGYTKNDTINVKIYITSIYIQPKHVVRSRCVVSCVTWMCGYTAALFSLLSLFNFSFFRQTCAPGQSYQGPSHIVKYFAVVTFCCGRWQRAVSFG